MTWRRSRRNSPCPITVERVVGTERVAAGRRSSCTIVRPARRSTRPSSNRWHRSWLEIQSQPRITSAPTSISIGEIDIDSRHVSPRQRCSRTGAPSPCAPPAAAVATDSGPARPDKGRPSASVRRAQIKQCDAPVSSKTVTRLRPWAVAMCPDSRGWNVGSLRTHGRYSAAPASVARCA